MGATQPEEHIMSTDIDFKSLTPDQQEAYIARGEYKFPERLDQGNAPKGAPAGPVPFGDASVGNPDPLAVEDKPRDDKPKTAKRT